MNQYVVQESAVINASAETIYQILIDYEDPNAHRAITPPSFFTKIDVVSGGTGDGTVVDVYGKAMGQVTKLTLTLTEVKKNRHLLEKDDNGGIVTEFFLDPVDGDEQTEVTIKTTGTVARGLRGWVEKKLSPRILRPVYQEELENLERVASNREKIAL